MFNKKKTKQIPIHKISEFINPHIKTKNIHAILSSTGVAQIQIADIHMKAFHQYRIVRAANTMFLELVNTRTNQQNARKSMIVAKTHMKLMEVVCHYN